MAEAPLSSIVGMCTRVTSGASLGLRCRTHSSGARTWVSFPKLHRGAETEERRRQWQGQGCRRCPPATGIYLCRSWLFPSFVCFYLRRLLGWPFSGCPQNIRAISLVLGTVNACVNARNWSSAYGSSFASSWYSPEIIMATPPGWSLQEQAKWVLSLPTQVV